MNELITKKVDFNGTQLMAVKNETSGKIYVGVSWVCNGIGFSKSQKDWQIQSMQKDLMLKRGCLFLQAGVFDPNNTTLAIELDYLPLWLAKISITPKMQEEQPELAEKLIEYQLKAKDVLAQAFLPKKQMSYLELLAAQAQALVDIERSQREQQQEIKQINTKLDNVSNIVSLDTTSWREDTRKLVVRIAQAWGGNDHIRDVRSEIYSLVEKRGGVNLKARLTNKRARMADNGSCKSARDKLTNLDIIAEDKKLIEIYTAIVKEMAVKYNVWNEEREYVQCSM